jgi:hypothetical protein
MWRMMSSRWRLAGPVGLLGVATLVVGALAATNPWRYVALYPWRTPLVLVTGALLTGVALLLATRKLARRTVLASLLGCLLLALLCVGVGLLMRPAGPDRMAVSPDGSFEVVKSTVDGRVALLVRSRGLLGRESTTPIAQCGHDPFGADMPPQSVRFTSNTTVAIPVREESTVVVRFDPGTLRPDRTVLMCP